MLLRVQNETKYQRNHVLLSSTLLSMQNIEIENNCNKIITKSTGILCDSEKWNNPKRYSEHIIEVQFSWGEVYVIYYLY